MKRRFQFMQVIAVGCLCCAAAPVLAGDADRPGVLFGGHGHASSPAGFQVSRALDEAGFAVRTATEMGGLDEHKLSWDEIRRFRVLVLVGLGYSRADGKLGEVVESNLAMVERFVEAGGGLLIVPYWCQQLTQVPPQDALASKYGLTLHWDDCPVDPAPVTATPWRIDYAYTDRVTEGPLSHGVPGLWYPVSTRTGAQTHLVPFSAPDLWRIAVAAAASTQTRHLAIDGANNPAQAKDPGKAPAGFPIAAWRQAGKGRVAIVALAPQHWLGEVAETTLEGVVTTEGLRGKLTGGRQLLLNAVRWLAGGEATPDIGRGPIASDPEMLQDPSIVRKSVPFVWPETVRPPDERVRDWPGVLGARTARGGGKGTVAEWVAAAKARGLKWIGFLEDIGALKQADFEALKAECAAATTADFAAVPGFAIDDEVGNHYAYVGAQLPWPRAELRTADGARWTSYDPEESPAKPGVPGRLSMTSLIYTHGDAGHRLTALNYRFHDDAAPFSDFFCNWSAFGVVSGKDGQLVEDALTDWLEVTASGQGGFPVSVDILSDPALLANLERRTVLRLPGGGKSCPVPAYFNEFRSYPDNPTSAYVTDGPVVEAWSFSGPRDYEGAMPGDFVLPNLRWRVHVAASSPKGLNEVAIYDGTELFRRWLPGGQERFTVDIDLNHERQHHLVLVVTDKEGRRAITQAQWDRNHRLEEFICGDRNNQLTYGLLIDKAGGGVLLGGNACQGTPWKRVDGREISPAGVFKNDRRLGAPAFDGAAFSEPRIWLPMNVRTPKGEIVAPPVCQAFRSLASADFHVGDARYEHRFTDGVPATNCWHTLWRTTPSQDVKLNFRRIFLRPDPDQPLGVFVLECTLTALRDLDTSEVTVGTLAPAGARLWQVGGRDGVCSGAVEEPGRSPQRSLHMPLGQGGHVTHYDSPLGAAAFYALTDGLTAIVNLPKADVRLVLTGEKVPRKTGDRSTVRLLGLGIPRSTPKTRQIGAPTTEIVARFGRDFGITGMPAWKITPSAGTVTERAVFTEIDGAQSACFRGRLEGEPCSTVAMRVTGANSRWSACLWDAARGIRPVPVFEGAAWAVTEVRGRADVFVGHPVVADNPNCVIAVVQTDPVTWAIEAHNPTDQALTATVRPNPAFEPLGPQTEQRVELAPGTSRQWQWKVTPTGGK